MKFGVVNKSTTVNRFVVHTLQRNITHLAVITRKINIKLGILKGGETGKEPNFVINQTWWALRTRLFSSSPLDFFGEQIFTTFLTCKKPLNNFWTTLFWNFTRGLGNWKRAESTKKFSQVGKKEDFQFWTNKIFSKFLKHCSNSIFFLNFWVWRS